MLRRIEGSRDVADAAALCRPEVICAYPISPQAHIVEALAEHVKSGRLTPCEFVILESEFAAMSVAIGASAVGARAYTATARQGLLFMAEAVYNASGLGLPIVMTVANTWLFDARWRVDAALSASAPLVSLIEEAADIADTIGLIRLTSAGVSLIETKITADSFAACHAVDQLTLPPNTVVAAVIHDGALTVPGGGYRFRPDDAVLVISGSATDGDIHDTFQREP
jgi:pyruvate ferredoxin oxidoreductase alpha subunit